MLIRRGMVLGGKYTLVGRIGVGAMGEVWRAEEGELGRQVAVKILRPELLNDPTFVARFRREARLLSTLSHANVVRVFAYGEGRPAGDGGSDGGGDGGGDGEGDAETEAQPLYIVMELIDGRPLDEIVEENGGTLPADRVLPLLAQALEGLHDAHQRDIVHRDIKPANLMLRADGHVMVTDFGIARATAGTKLTDDHSVVGTALYMAPEQVEGEVVPACDLYAVGVVCYQLLTGALPFTGDSPLDVMWKHVNQPPPELPRTLPEPVRAFVARALAKRPEDRYADAAAMAEAARRAAAGEPIPGGVPLPPPLPPRPPQSSAQQATPERKPPRERKRRPRPGMLLLPLVIVVSAGTGMYLMPWPGQPGEDGTLGVGPSVSAPEGGGQQPEGGPTDPGERGERGERGEKGSPSPKESETEPSPSDTPSDGEQGGDAEQAGGSGDQGSGSVAGGAASGGGDSGGAGGASGGSGGGGSGSGGGGGGSSPPPDDGPDPPDGCGGDGWGHITSVADGRRVGLASGRPDEGVEVVMGGTTSLGWVRGEGPLPSWEAFHACNRSSPSLSGDENGLHLSSEGGPWVLESASGGASRIKLDGAGDLGCLTNSGGDMLTVAPCDSGNEYQMWHLPG
ncbi:protein kinase domain-containing protein [Streptomyces sp. 6N223]|uniref:protein kinase domain-containing protein n=1 Tax=Streptomyces sp. 6N223 TaxID=3457412 RepID=UPI003FD61B19